MDEIVIAGEGEFSERTNRSLQMAVDRVARTGGGEVIVRPGVYLMHDSLHMPSKVVLSGEGEVVLKKTPGVVGRLKHIVGYGHYEFALHDSDAAGFEVGMGIHITDDHAGGFYDTIATIVGREGEYLFISRPANHDYSEKSGVVRSLYPVVSICDAADVGLENIRIEGDDNETYSLNGCRAGGVYMLRTQRAYLENVEVKGFNGDGVSFQQCADIAISNCRLMGNTGQGLHPGSGSVRYVMQNNRVINNQLHGIFYCLRTSHSICQGNEIRGNRDMGITIGERDTDHLIRENVIEGNGGYGIDFRQPRTCGGDRVVIEANRLRNNCQREGEVEISIHGGINDVQIGDNHIEYDKGKALAVGQDCLRISFYDNQVNGVIQSKGHIDMNSEVAMDPPSEKLDVGPTGKGAQMVRHLGMNGPD